MTIPSRFRRPTAALAATVLALPLTVAAVAPAAAGVHAVLVDRGWPSYPGYGNPGYGIPGYGYADPYASTSAPGTSVASARRSEELVTITSKVDFGAGQAAGTGDRARRRRRMVAVHSSSPTTTSSRAPPASR